MIVYDLKKEYENKVRLIKDIVKRLKNQKETKK